MFQLLRKLKGGSDLPHHKFFDGWLGHHLSEPGAGISGVVTKAATSLNMSKTGLSTVDGILTGSKWGATNLTYSFPKSASHYEYAGEKSSGFGAFDGNQIAAVKSILGQYAAISNLNFTEVKESASVHGTLRFAETSKASTAFAYYPSSKAQGGDTPRTNPCKLGR